VRPYLDMLKAYADLRKGPVGGVVEASSGAQYIMLKNRRLRAPIVQYSSEPLFQEGFAFPKGSALVAVVNAALQKVEANGTYLKITGGGSVPIRCRSRRRIARRNSGPPLRSLERRA